MIRPLLCSVLLATALAGCSKPSSDLQPPTIYYGQTPCAECGMIVSDEHYAAAMLTRTAGGEQQELAFDDIGCMVEYQKKHLGPGGDAALATFVKDFETRQWVPAERAWFVYGGQVHSPMAYGLLAVADQARGRALQERYHGHLADFQTLQHSDTGVEPATGPSGR